MKNASVVLSGLMLAAASVATQAQDMSYSYVDVGYVESDVDDAPSADGFGVRGSAAFAENWFVFGEYSSQDLGPAEIDQFAVGFGGRYGLTQEMDLVGRVGYVDGEASAGPFTIDVDGYLLSVGLRGQIGEGFELEGRIDHVDLGDDGDDTSIAIAGRYFFTEMFAIGAELSSSDDVDTIFAGVRFSF